MELLHEMAGEECLCELFLTNSGLALTDGVYLPTVIPAEAKNIPGEVEEVGSCKKLG